MNNLFSSGDVQMKTVDQTVKHAEKYLGDICYLLGSYTRKTAKVRDKADLLVAQFFDFSSTEGPELQVGLKNLAEDLAMVQDYRQAQIERLETRVVAPLKAFGDIVKIKKADVKKFNTDLNRQLRDLQKLDRIRLRNPADRQSIEEVNAQKACNNAKRSIRLLQETISDFQKQKLEDIKRIFTDFITIEMLFHAKALEVFTHTYHNLEAIDIQKDQEVFNGRLKVSESLTGHLDNPLSSHSSPLMSHNISPLLASLSGQSLRSIIAPTTGHGSRQQHKQLSEKVRWSRSTLQRQRGMEKEEEEEEVDDEEVEEEKDMDESEMEDAQSIHRQSYAARYVQIRR